MCFICRTLHPRKEDKEESFVNPIPLEERYPFPKLPQDKPIPYFNSDYPTVKYCNKCGQRIYDQDPKKHHGWVKGHPP